MKSSKSQPPSSREISSANIQTTFRSHARIRSLKFGASLVLGVWSLVLLATMNLLAQSYSVDWFTIDGGGGVSSGGSYTLSGTIGQPDAGTLSGGNYTLEGGFWPGIVLPSSTGVAPTLSIQLSDNNVVVSWPSPSTGFVLQQTASLGTPTWNNVVQAPGDNGAIKGSCSLSLRAEPSIA